MIESLRKWGGSWSAKILLGVLAGSMGIFWGMGDLFTGKGPFDIVATVGDSEISSRDLRRELEIRLSFLEQKIGKRLEPEQIKTSRLHAAVLMDMVQQALIDEEATRLKLVIADTAVKKAVTQNPAFQDASRKFSRELFEKFLKASGLYEKKFIETLKKDLRRQQLLKAFSGTLQLPDVMGSLLLKAQFQDRYGAITTIPASKMKVIKPARSTLETFYTSEKERFRTPERRTFIYAVLDPQVLAVTTEVSAAEIQKTYDKRAAEFNKKGQKIEEAQDIIRQEIMAQKVKNRLYEIAGQIEDDLASGLSLEKVAGKYSLSLKRVSSCPRVIGTKDKDTQALLPGDPAFAQEILNEAFQTLPNSDPQLRRLQNGIHYFIAVEKIFPSQIPPFEVVLDAVQDVWTQEKKAEQAFQAAQNLAQGIRAGRETSKNFQKLPPVSLRRTAQEDAGVPPHVKTILFEMESGDVRAVQNLSGEAFVVQLISVEEADLKAAKDQIPSFLDQVKNMYEEDVMQAYIQSLRPRYHVKINREALNRVL